MTVPKDGRSCLLSLLLVCSGRVCVCSVSPGLCGWSLCAHSLSKVLGGQAAVLGVEGGGGGGGQVGRREQGGSVVRRRICKTREELALDSKCEQHDATGARQCPPWRADAAPGLLRSGRWEPEGRACWQPESCGRRAGKGTNNCRNPRSHGPREQVRLTSRGWGGCCWA